MSFLAPRPRGVAPVVLPPEIDFLVTEGVPLPVLACAAEAARTSATDAATALLAAGLLSEATYYRALARVLGRPFVDEDLTLGADAPYPRSLALGRAPLAGGGRVLAPRGQQIAALLAGADEGDYVLTTPTRLRLAVFATCAEAIAAHAADDLGTQRPEWAYRPGLAPARAGLAAAFLVGLAVAANLPGIVGLATLAALQVAALAMLTFRLAALGVEAGTTPKDDAPALPDAALPTYTVLVALHREAAVVPRLVHALAHLDYPAAKLDIKFLIEAHDTTTAAALAQVPFPARFETVVVPPGLPRTKPRALNAALPLARGACLVVYDAEDVPDPGQLRAAAGIFARASADVACLQGRLVIDNAQENWLTRCFALEYSALFDVLGPALTAWQVPVPLGGTTTHFRTAALRAVHGWDAWNVTEDADLGIRLSLAGYRVDDLPSSTDEEAPAAIGPWLHQRARWMKGFLQTTVTHGRHPVETARRLGPLGTLCFLAMVPGTVVSALCYPFLTGAALSRLLVEGPAAAPAYWPNLPGAAALVVLGSGFAAMALPALLGCLRRGWWDLIAFVPLLPAYYLLVSVAAWMGLVELVRTPFRWNKTEHGLSRTSRSGALRLRRTHGPRVRGASPVQRPSPAAAGRG